jgi:hypothetical protein
VRRLLRLLTAVSVGAALLGAPPAQAAEVTWLSVQSFDPLLNENGDGYWESATVTVRTDAEAAHWVLARGSQVVAGADLTAEQLESARATSGAGLAVSSATVGGPLAAGTYSFSVTATSNGEEPTTRATNVYVSSAPPLGVMRPSAAAIYPADYFRGVAHEVTFRHGLDATILKWGAPMFEVVSPAGSHGPWAVAPGDPLLHWDGSGGYPPANGGTYRVRLLVQDDQQLVAGPTSGAFELSWNHRDAVERETRRTAAASRTRTLTQRGARLRIQDGSLRYRATNTDWRNGPTVRTAHVLRVPPGRAPGQPVFLVVRGSWQHTEDSIFEVVLPDGRIRVADIWEAAGPYFRRIGVPRSWIRTDGTIRFRLVWTSMGDTGTRGRVGRADSVGIRYSQYVWREATTSPAG